MTLTAAQRRALEWLPADGGWSFRSPGSEEPLLVLSMLIRLTPTEHSGSSRGMEVFPSE